MHFKLCLAISVALSVSVHGSGYFPSVGGPYSRYTTTTPSPGEGFNLPATEAPPPSVTFVPRPRPIPQRPTTDSNNRVDGQNQNENSMQQQNYLIVTDPMTGEQFVVPKHNFWNRVGNGATFQPARGQQGQGSNSRNPQLQSEEGFNRNAEEGQDDFLVTQPRAKRSSVPEELTSDELNVNKEESEELRHIEMLADDSAEEKSLGDSPVLRFDNLNAIDSREDERPGFGGRMAFKSSADLFQIFFPSLKLNQGKKMIYTYTQYRHNPVEEYTTTPITTITSTTTPVPTTPEQVEETTTTVENEQTGTTTVVELEENTEVPQITTNIPLENASPNLS